MRRPSRRNYIQCKTLCLYRLKLFLWRNTHTSFIMMEPTVPLIRQSRTDHQGSKVQDWYASIIVEPVSSIHYNDLIESIDWASKKMSGGRDPKESGVCHHDWIIDYFVNPHTIRCNKRNKGSVLTATTRRIDCMHTIHSHPNENDGWLTRFTKRENQAERTHNRFPWK
jgi:hypothetical protein